MFSHVFLDTQKYIHCNKFRVKSIVQNDIEMLPFVGEFIAWIMFPTLFLKSKNDSKLGFTFENIVLKVRVECID